MKKLFLFATLFCCNTHIYAQSASDFIWRGKIAKTEMNKTAKKAVDYILSTPADTSNAIRIAAEQYLTIWISETDSTYIYATSLEMSNILRENKEQGYVYWAAMVEAVMNDKEQDPENAVEYASKKLVAYACNKHNKLQPGAHLTAMIAASKQGKLKEYVEHKNAIRK